MAALAMSTPKRIPSRLVLRGVGERSFIADIESAGSLETALDGIIPGNAMSE